MAAAESSDAPGTGVPEEPERTGDPAAAPPTELTSAPSNTAQERERTDRLRNSTGLK